MPCWSSVCAVLWERFCLESPSPWARLIWSFFDSNCRQLDTTTKATQGLSRVSNDPVSTSPVFVQANPIVQVQDERPAHAWAVIWFGERTNASVIPRYGGDVVDVVLAAYAVLLVSKFPPCTTLAYLSSFEIRGLCHFSYPSTRLPRWRRRSVVHCGVRCLARCRVDPDDTSRVSV